MLVAPSHSQSADFRQLELTFHRQISVLFLTSDYESIQLEDNKHV